MTNALWSNVTATPVKVCPVAPPGAQAHADQLMGYVLWGIGILFFLGVVIGIAAAVAGRVFGMPHASKAGIVGVVIVFIAIICYLVLPGVVEAMTGNGCIPSPSGGGGGGGSRGGSSGGTYNGG